MMGTKLLFITVAVALIAATAFAESGKSDAEAGEKSTELKREKKEIENFASLLTEMDELRLPREMSDFWQINTEVRIAMRRELERAPENAPGERVARMNAIRRESHGLEVVLASGDMDVLDRYRHLLGEFLSLMREDAGAVEVGHIEDPH